MEDILSCNGSLDDELNDNSWSLVYDDIASCTSGDNFDSVHDDHEFSNNSSNCEFYGFNTPPPEKQNYYLNLLKNITVNCDTEERDVIDGIEFMSFTTEYELMAYSRLQQEQRATASQSDDGLEILDDGSFSDISSNHAIVPTKTKDITRIKGWRNKHFAGIPMCDDSGSSLRNDDDGFGDDFEINSVHDDSSEEGESTDFMDSNASKCGFDAESFNLANSSDMFSQSPIVSDTFSATEASVVEETNPLDRGEDSEFNFQKSIKPQDSANDNIILKPFVTNSREVKQLDLSFNNKLDVLKGVFMADNNSNLSSMQEELPTKNNTDSFTLPTSLSQNSQDNQSKDLLENKVVYKPRVKQSLIESITQKINATIDNNLLEKDNPTTSKSDSSNKQIVQWHPKESVRFHVPKEKLLSGNIFDLEVSLAAYPKLSKYETGSGLPDLSEPSEITGTKSIQNNFKLLAASSKNENEQSESIGEEEMCDEEKRSIGAFQSSTLDQYTTNLGELHIDFTIPKLDAADNVTHVEIYLPQKDNITPSPPRNKLKPENSIKAKTVAEKRRLLAEMNKCSKRKKKLSYKLRANSEKNTSSSLHQTRSHITKNKHFRHINSKIELKNKIKVPQKKIQVIKKWFDEQGVITYGREKPLRHIFTKNLLSSHKNSLHLHDKTNSKSIGMILNIGFKRPLYREAANNIKYLLDDKPHITEDAAKFAVSAVQHSVKGPFKVTRILVPVVDEELIELMYSRFTNRKNLRKNLIKTTAKTFKKQTFIQECLNFSRKSMQKMSEKSKQFAKTHNIESEVCNVVSELTSFVERKEFVKDLQYEYDPDIPVPIEKENGALLYSIDKSKLNEKKKKTKLQRQIEHLGGTFIAVQGEEGNEENLSKASESGHCSKDHCKMGCACSHETQREEHCGKEVCMFFCHCPPNSKRKERSIQGCEIKSKIWLLPEVLRLQNTSQSKLAPVEREYHQTIIMSKDKKTITIETKYKKRERKIPSKFKDEILLDYRKEGDDDECIILSNGDSNRPLKCSFQEEFLLNSPICPTISSLESFLNKPKSVSSASALKAMKHCYVKIENDDNVNKLIKEISFVPGLYTNKYKCDKPVRSKELKSSSRNVAKKKTASTTSHSFDVQNYCSRTYGVSMYYQQRNTFYKMRTRNMLLYASAPHATEINYIEDVDDSYIIKEDLQFEVGSYDGVQVEDNETICLENISQEEESSLAIDFICSLPPELFDKQDSADFEGCVNELQTSMASTSKNNRKETFINDVSKRKKKFRGRKETKYATLPFTENVSKWWVVEVDERKFSTLVYSCDKRFLNIEHVLRASFTARYGKKTVRILLNKPFSSHEDKFGAYVVPGHKHLVFFGPYERNEAHGLTAIKLEGERFRRVPFTTRFLEGDKFRSLGIDMSGNNDFSPTVSQRSVKAVWWYSTGVRGTSENERERGDSEVRADVRRDHYIGSPDEHNHQEEEIGLKREDVKAQSSSSNHIDFISTNDVQKQNSLRIGGQGKKCLSKIAFNDAVCVEDRREDNISTSLDALKTEPIHDQYESNDETNSSTQAKKEVIEETSNSSESSNRSVDPVKISSLKFEPNKDLSDIQYFASIRGTKSIEEKLHLAEMRKQVTEKNVNKELKTKKIVSTNINQFNNNMNIISLKKKITDLSNVISSAGPSSSKKTIQKPLADLVIDSENSSSTFNDDDFCEENSTDQDSSSESLDSSTVERIIHKTIKTLKPSKSREDSTTGILPKHLMQTPTQGPCPDLALLCLTPNIGYICVTEYCPGKLVIQDPAHRNVEHQFNDLAHASSWLNELFMKKFTFEVKFEMQWLLTKGSLIRYLQPLSRHIFQLSPEQAVITPEGLETHVKFKQILRNKLERERRLKISKCFTKLAKEVFPLNNEKSGSQAILSNAVHMVEAQRLIALELSRNALELTRHKSNLNDQLKSIFADLTDHVEKKKALALCKHIKCCTYDNGDITQEHLESMRVRELELVEKLRKTPISNWNISRANSKRKSNTVLKSSGKGTDNPESLLNLSETSNTSTTFEVPETAKVRPTEGILVRRGKLNIKNRKSALPVTSQKTSSEVINLIDSDNEGEQDKVIEIESEEEEEDVIWLPTAEQQDKDVEIILDNCPKKRQKLMMPKPKKKMPPPLRQESPPPPPLFVNFGTTPTTNIQETVIPNVVSHRSSTAMKILGFQSENSSSPSLILPSTSKAVPSENKHVSPIAMVVNPSVYQQSTSSVKKQQWTPGPEFVVVNEEEYEPVNPTHKLDSNVSSCRQTDVVSKNIPASVPPVFLPSSRVNIVNTSATTFVTQSAQKVNTVVKKPLILRKAGYRLIPSLAGLKVNKIQEDLTKNRVVCKNVMQIGRINPKNTFCKIRGKPILLCKSESGFKIAKLPPSIKASRPVTCVPATALKIAKVVRTTNTPEERISPERANTVTLYHASEDLSETRPVQFASVNSVRVESSSSIISEPNLSGPIIQRPKNDKFIKLVLSKEK